MNALAFTSVGAAGWLAILADAALKSVAVLLIVLGATRLLRRSSSSVRHMVWTLSVVGLILVPVLSLALPQLQVPLLPDWAVTGGTARPDEPARAGTEAPPAALPEPIDATAPTSVPPEFSAGPGAPEFPDADFPPIAATPIAEPQPDAAPESPDPAPAAATQSHVPAWPTWVLLAWLAGAAAMLLPLLVGTAVVWWQARRAQRITDGEWVGLLGDLRRQLGIHRRVGLLRSNWPSIPLTCGIFRPKIILPAEADAWPADRRRIVLLHELAHVRRADCLTQLLARLARVIYWFNPLVWLAGRMLRIEREQACDDLVLASGHKASDYAQHLLEIVRSLHATRCPSLAAVAMAGRGQFEGRLRAILDPRRNRRALTRLGVLLAAVLVAGLIIPLACMKATGKGTDAATEAASAGDETSSADAPAEGDVQVLESGLFTVSAWDGQVIIEGFLKDFIRSETNRYGIRKDVAEAIGKALKDKFHVELTDQSRRAIASDGTEYWDYASDDEPMISVVGESSGVIEPDLLPAGTPAVEYAVKVSKAQSSLHQPRTEEGKLVQKKSTTIGLYVSLWGNGLRSGLSNYREGWSGDVDGEMVVRARQPERALNDSGASSASDAATPSGKTDMTPATQPAAAATRPVSEDAWGEEVKGLRLRVSVPPGGVYRRATGLPLRVELRNVGTKPVAYSRLGLTPLIEARAKADAAEPVRLVALDRAPVNDGDYLNHGALAAGQTLAWTIGLERVETPARWPAGQSLQLSLRLGVRGEGFSPQTDSPLFEVVSQPVTVKLADDFPAALGADEIPATWTPAMALIYRERGMWWGYTYLRVDGQGQALLIRMRSGRSDKVIPTGVYETTLSKEQLGALVALLRGHEFGTRRKVVPRTDMGETTLVLSVGGAVARTRFEEPAEQREPALAALRADMRKLMVSVVQAALTAPATETGATRPITWKKSPSGLESRLESEVWKGGDAIRIRILVRNLTDKDIPVGGFGYDGTVTLDGEEFHFFPRPILRPSDAAKLQQLIKSGETSEFATWYYPIKEGFQGALKLESRKKDGSFISPNLEPGRHSTSFELGPIQTEAVEFEVPSSTTTQV